MLAILGPFECRQVSICQEKNLQHMTFHSLKRTLPYKFKVWTLLLEYRFAHDYGGTAKNGRRTLEELDAKK